MSPRLIHFLTTDNLRLPGLLYEPAKKSKKVAIYLHGNGTSSIFYSRLHDILGNQLTNSGIAYFPFNNRGAHLIKSLKRTTAEGDERILAGTAYELIKDCVKDIEGAIEYLSAKHGYREFYLIGESTGANKIVVYHYHKRNETEKKKQNSVSKYILISGGDDTGLYYQQLGNRLFIRTIARARDEIQKGNAEKLTLRPFDIPYSYQSIVDILNPDGDYNIFPFNEYLNSRPLSIKKLFREFETIDIPTLVIYGAEDEYCYGNVAGCVDALKTNVVHKKLFTFNIVDGADHGFTGFEEPLTKTIATWLTKNA